MRGAAGAVPSTESAAAAYGRVVPPHSRIAHTCSGTHAAESVTPAEHKQRRAAPSSPGRVVQGGLLQHTAARRIFRAHARCGSHTASSGLLTRASTHATRLASRQRICEQTSPPASTNALRGSATARSASSRLLSPSAASPPPPAASSPPLPLRCHRRCPLRPRRCPQRLRLSAPHAPSCETRAWSDRRSPAASCRTAAAPAQS